MSEFWFKVGVVFVGFLMLYDYYCNESKYADALFAYISFFSGNSDTYQPDPPQNTQAPEPAPSNASNTGSIERASVCEEWNTLEILMFPFILLAMATLSLVTFFVEDEDDLRSDATPAYGI